MDLVLSSGVDEDDILNLLTLQQIKQNERVFHSQQDDLFTDSIKAAYGFLDGPRGWLNRAILTQSWILYLPAFCDTIDIPLPPLQSVTAVKYIDCDGATQTAATSLYEVITEDGVGQVKKISGQQWPETKVLQRAVWVEFVAGFGAASEIDVSDRVKINQAMKLLASHFYRSPSATFGEPRTVNVNRKTEFGLEHLVGFLRIPASHE